jgi:hypothetical protein
MLISSRNITAASLKLAAFLDCYISKKKLDINIVK